MGSDAQLFKPQIWIGFRHFGPSPAVPMIRLSPLACLHFIVIKSAILEILVSYLIITYPPGPHVSRKKTLKKTCILYPIHVIPPMDPWLSSAPSLPGHIQKRAKEICPEARDAARSRTLRVVFGVTVSLALELGPGGYWGYLVSGSHKPK